MSGYRLVWLEIAEDQYTSQPDELRALIDRRISWLLDDPIGDSDVVYHRVSDQYSVPLGDRGFLFFAAVTDPPTMIILRIVVT